MGVKLVLNPALGRGTPGVAGPAPGAIKQASVPVKAYSPLRSRESAAAIVAQAKTAVATEHINARCMKFLPWAVARARASGAARPIRPVSRLSGKERRPADS